jgi:hypothetical protein
VSTAKPRLRATDSRTEQSPEDGAALRGAGVKTGSTVSSNGERARIVDETVQAVREEQIPGG